MTEIPQVIPEAAGNGYWFTESGEYMPHQAIPAEAIRVVEERLRFCTGSPGADWSAEAILILEAAAPHMLDNSTNNQEQAVTISRESIHAAAKTIAGFNGEGWQFEPPRMDGVTRSGLHASVYFRQAEEVLTAAAEAERHAHELGTPVSDTK